ncbi:unnamed protein product [[Actinomadura] parvosata subsp. kistnae]|uniref:Uncharacterized protein n=1 Tax=[Actinomadura] parvosata subsp. kistnae TaxID=1909395 RepID=A0A1U9ZR49_9ACTN|nr:hypothetical protein [Nonomuraea sp. ATCC 55076]AQZ60426.1 hypothetical protein BKM31_01860 [Nonomuraea sp. ATCC 55076]SPL91042.1 unnamed protein product [Actinomadura parvosata subsp. kistnae]
MTTQDTRVEQVPPTALIARYILTFQVACGVVGTALAAYLLIGSGLATAFLLLLLASVAFVVLSWLLVARWPSRRRVVRWGAVGVEVAVCGLALAAAGSGGGGGPLAWSVLPVAAVVLLLTPSAGRWFDR